MKIRGTLYLPRLPNIGQMVNLGVYLWERFCRRWYKVRCPFNLAIFQIEGTKKNHPRFGGGEST